MAQQRRYAINALATGAGGKRAANVADRHAKAAAWHRMARDKAVAFWKRNPRRKASEVARDVRNALVREGVTSAAGKNPPGERQVRKVISRLKPSAMQKVGPERSCEAKTTV